MMTKAGLFIAAFVAFQLASCAPLPTREDASAFRSRQKGEVTAADVPKFMDCVIDRLDRTENGTRWNIRTSQIRRSTGYRVERRWDFDPSLLILSVDIYDDGNVELFENLKLRAISPFLDAGQEFDAVNSCILVFGSKK